MAAEYHATAFVERTFLCQDLAATVKADLKNVWHGGDVPATQAVTTCVPGARVPDGAAAMTRQAATVGTTAAG